MKRKIGAILLAVALALALGVVPAAPVAADPDPSLLVALWHFDEGAGVTAYDSSGNGNHGTIHGATWVDGKFGKALSFDGVDDYVAVPHSSSLNIDGTGITLEAWVNPDELPPAGARWQVIGKADAYALQVADGGKVRVWLGPLTTYVQTDAVELSAGSWHHIAGTYDGSSVCIYVNGALKKMVAKTGNQATSLSDLIIGARIPGGYFNGAIDEVRIWNMALPADAIAQSYELGGPQSEEPGPVVEVKHQFLSDGEVVLFTSAFYLGRQEPETEKTVDIYIMSSSGERDIEGVNLRQATPAGTNGGLDGVGGADTHWCANVTNGAPGIRGRTSTSIHLSAELDTEELLGVNAQYLPYD